MFFNGLSEIKCPKLLKTKRDGLPNLPQFPYFSETFLLQNSLADGVLYVCKQMSSCKSLIPIWSKGFETWNNIAAMPVHSGSGETSKGDLEESHNFSIVAKSSIILKISK